ncbi:MAG: BNR repeat-containing protein [Myxococcaceae bacterium]|nr:BNR repeat-containing protein [Myxococcaceae bacterium]
MRLRAVVGLSLIAATPLLAAFIEVLTVQTVEQHLGTFGTAGHNLSQIAAGPSKVFVAYQTERANNASVMEYWVAQYDYATGAWTKTLAATSGVAGGNSIHNAPALFRHPVTGILELFYAPNDCAYRDALGSPCYKASQNPDDTTLWGPEQRVPNGSFNTELSGGYTPDGALHLFGRHGSGNYLRRDPQGQWSGATFLINAVGSGTNDQAANIGGIKISGNTLHVTWGVYQPSYIDSNGLPYFSGDTDSTYYARSDDGGDTWSSADGTATFTRAQGLAQVGTCLPRASSANFQNPPCQYPAAFKVRGGKTSTIGRDVDVLPNGAPVIADFDTVNASLLFRWSGTAWAQHSVDSEGFMSPAMEVTSSGDIVIHAIRLSDTQGFEMVSSNQGINWARTPLFGGNPRWPVTTVMQPPGERERIVLAWDERVGGEVDVKVWDRPRPPGLAPSPPQNLQVQ